MTLETPRGNYSYETHLHTSEGSACGQSSGAAMAQAYARAGYAGIIVTDHFFNGNCAVSADLPWADRVERFCLGFENARAAGEELGLSVFFGWEYNYNGTEFLTYGLGKDYLLSHPDILQWELTTYLDRVREAGALVSQAHPFRQRPYIPYTRLLHNHTEAAEIHNASEPKGSNTLAAHYVEANNLAFTAGSDAHNADNLRLSGMTFPKKLNSINDFISAVRNKQASPRL